MKSWNRLENESDAAFEAFKIYLELDERSLQKVANLLHKNGAVIRRWASQYNWRERARDFDNSILEDVRQEIKRSLSREIKRQWKESIALQRLSFEALSVKDMSKASFKSLNEIYCSARQAQWDIVDRLKLDETDDNIKIEIVDASQSEGD